MVESILRLSELSLMFVFLGKGLVLIFLVNYKLLYRFSQFFHKSKICLINSDPSLACAIVLYQNYSIKIIVPNVQRREII